MNSPSRIPFQPPRFAVAWIIKALGASFFVLPAAADTPGTPWTGEAGITETVAALTARDRAQDLLGRPPVRHKPLLRPDRHGLPPDPGSSSAPLTTSTPSTARVQNTGPLTSQVVGTSFTGATLADCNAYPPDTMGAAGPTQFIVAVNGRIRSFNKTTGVADGALNLSMDTFFNSVMTPPASNNFTSDPHIRYDRLSGRWFVIMIDVPGTNGTLPNRVLIAVSSGSTITSTSSFTFFYFQHDTVTPAGDTGSFADYPTLGIDNNALYIGDNVFNSSGSFTGCSGFVVRKTSVLGAGPIVVTAFRGLVPSSGSDGPFTPQGVDNYDPAATEGYFIGVSNTTNGRLIVRRVSTPGGTPTISTNIAITTASTQDPITVPHLGNTGGKTGYLDSVDDRLFAAHLRNGRLWTAHNIQVNSSGNASSKGGRNGSRWYEIQNLTGTPSVVQSGTVFDSASSNPKSYWIPSIMVSGQGHVAMGFSTAGTNYRVNAGTVGRLAGDTAGTMQVPVEYTASSTAYNPSGDPGGSSGRRWGDFSFTSLDPNDDMTMWTIQEFCDSTNSYGVRVAKLIAPPPATPASCSPSSIAIGQASVNVTVTGTQISGSGFFDPGAGFANRIAAAVGGGVVVNSITCNSPTSVTMNLNTTAASGGARTVTVTNPDGQATTSATAILTIVANSTVVSLNRANTDPTNAATVNWLLTLNIGSSGVTTGNFSLTGTAAGGATVGTPTTADGGTNWTVPVTNGPADGTLTLNLTSATGIFPPLASTLPWAGQSYTMDHTTQTPALTIPAANAISNNPVGVSFTLPESALTGSVQLLFSGAATRTLTLAASQASSGTHTFTFNPANPLLSTQIAGITGGTDIPDGIYAITLSYQDALGNPAATITNTNILIDTTAPVVTPPANVTTEATSAAGAVVTYPPATATDAFGVSSLTYSQNSGTTFPIGITTVTVTATDTANNIGTAPFTVNVTITPLQSWRQQYFGDIGNTGNAADTADPNNNGIVNLLEYALGGDPLGTTTGTTILPVIGRSTANTLQLGFTRYTDRTDLTLTVQGTDTLTGPWTDLAQSVAGAAFISLVPNATVTETGTGNTRNVTVADPYPLTDPTHPSRFMRLKVTNTSGQ